MNIPERVVAAARHASGVSAWIGHDDMRAAIIAGLKEWIASGEARKANAMTIGDADVSSWWGADERIPDGDDPDNFPVIIIRMEPDND